MQKKFIINLLLLIIVNLLVKPMAIFGVDAQVQNSVGSKEFGLYFSLLNLSLIFNIVSDLGLNNYLIKQTAQTPNVSQKYLGKIITFRFVLFIVYFIFTLILAMVIGRSFVEVKLLIILIINQFFIGMIAFSRAYFNGLLYFKTDAFLSVIDRLLLIVFASSIFFFNPQSKEITIEWYIQTQFICYFTAFIFALVLLLKEIGIPKLDFEKLQFFALLKKSLPYALLVLLMTLYTRTDVVILERLHPNGAQESGIYAQGFRLLDAVFMFGMLFANILFPIFAKQIKMGSPDLSQLVLLSRNLLLGGTFILVFLCLSQAQFILELLYTNDVSSSIFSFQLLMITFIPMGLNLIYGTLLTAKGELSFLIKTSVIGVVINFTCNLLLTPTYGAVGTALSALITQSAVVYILIVRANNIFNLEFQFIRIIKVLLSLVLIYFIKKFNLSLSYTFILQITLATCVLFVFKLISLTHLKKVFQDN